MFICINLTLEQILMAAIQANMIIDMISYREMLLFAYYNHLFKREVQS